MKRFTFTILLFLSAATAPAYIDQSFAQGIVIAKVPQSSYNLNRDPAAAARLNGAFTGAVNSANMQAALDSIGAGSGARVKIPISVDCGQYYVDGGVIIGQRSDGLPRAGGQFLGLGGTTPALESNTFTAGTGNAVRFVHVGERDADQFIFKYVGREWTLGPFELFGFPLVDSDDRNNRTSNTAEYTRCPNGIVISKVSAGFANGHLHAHMAFMGFEKAISVINTPIENHCDTLSWDYIFADSCTDVYNVANEQSVSHYVRTIITNAGVSRIFNFSAKGGDLIVDHCKVDGADATVLTVAVNSTNWNGYKINGLRFDNNADGFCLADLPDSFGGVGCQVTMTGSIGNDCDYDIAEVLVDEDPRDMIYFNFVGENGPVEDINDLSTVDAGGRWRRQTREVQVIAPGTTVTTGDGKAFISIPPELNGWRLELVHGGLDVASSSGTPTVQLRRVRAGSSADMLSTRQTFDADEVSSATAAAAAVIDASNDDVATGDKIYFDVDVAGTSTAGLHETLTFRRW